MHMFTGAQKIEITGKRRGANHDGVYGGKHAISAFAAEQSGG